MPVGNILVSNSGSNIEHDDTGLTVDVVTITETTELLLTGGIPDIELNGTQVLFDFELVGRHQRRGGHGNGVGAGLGGGIAYGSEGQRVNLDTESGNVLLLELASQVALDEGGLSYWLR